jgi:hypothetical protein
MKWRSFTWELDDEGGYSGQAKRWAMNRAHKRETYSPCLHHRNAICNLMGDIISGGGENEWSSAMKWGDFTWELDDEGGYSGQAKRWVMNRADKR